MKDRANNRRVVVLDAAALLSLQLERGYDFLVTSKRVIEEIRYGNLAPERIEAAVTAGVLQVLPPSAESIEKVKKVAETTGDLPFLSNADVEVLALAYEFKTGGYEVKIATDDYSVQNVALKLSIAVIEVRHPRVRRTVKWSFRCRKCGKQLRIWREECPVCGGEVAKVPR